MAAEEKSLSVEKAHVKCFEREYAAEAEKRQQSLVQRQGTTLLASCQLAESEGSFQYLQ